jgi:hypothetical protein
MYPNRFVNKRVAAVTRIGLPWSWRTVARVVRVARRM